MKRTVTCNAILVSVFICLLFCPTRAVFCQTFTITNLSSSSWSYSEAHAINAQGSVVGEYEPTNSISVQAFLYSNGSITDLGHLPGSPYAVGYGLNDTNTVGESNSAQNTHAFVYSPGKITDLGTLGGNLQSGYSSAHAINRAGRIVGESSISLSQVGTIHATLFNGKIDLGALGGDYSSANAINNFDIIVGESEVVIAGETNVHAFVYTNAAMHDLGTLGGGYSSAKSVNDSGVIVGEAETVSGAVTNLHAFIYRNGAMTDLGTFGGSTSSASAINNAGQIVGYATDVNDVSGAFLYDGGLMINLNHLIPTGSAWANLTSADAINDAGQIAGSGYLNDGSYQAYLLTPLTPLKITITNPIPNVILQAPATFDIDVAVSDPANLLTNVQFLVNSSVISNVSSAPYSATASSLPAGSYTLTAIAADAAGLQATNSIAITVSTNSLLPVTLLNPTFGAKKFSFSFATQAGFTYAGQFTGAVGSTNNWITFTNLSGNGSVVQVTDFGATDEQRTYRVQAH